MNANLKIYSSFFFFQENNKYILFKNKVGSGFGPRNICGGKKEILEVNHTLKEDLEENQVLKEDLEENQVPKEDLEKIKLMKEERYDNQALKEDLEKNQALKEDLENNFYKENEKDSQDALQS